MSDGFDPNTWVSPRDANVGGGRPAPPRTTSRSSSARPARDREPANSGYRQYADRYQDGSYDDGGYDDFGYDAFGYDDYNDKDLGAGDYGGLRRKALPIFVCVTALLAVMFLFRSCSGDEKTEGSPATNTAGAAEPGRAKSAPFQAQPAQTQPAQTQPAPAQAQRTTPQAPPDVTEGLDEAFAAWGQYAINGNLELVRPYFVNSGPQFKVFQAKAAKIRSNPPGGIPLEIKMTDPEATQINDNTWSLKGVVTIGTAGQTPAEYSWEITMARAPDRDRWRVMTIGNADTPL